MEGTGDIFLRFPGQSVIFSVEPGGIPKPSIIWSYEDSSLPINEPGSRFWQTSNGSLVILSTVYEDAGRYTAEMSNPFGTSFYTVALEFTLSECIRLI